MNFDCTYIIRDIPVNIQQQILKGLTFTCDYYHPGLTCNQHSLQAFLRTIKSFSPIYLPIHILPLLIYRRKELKKRQIYVFRLRFLATSARSLQSYIYSLLFISFMVGTSKFFLCFIKNRRKICDGWSVSIPILIGGLGLGFESSGRYQINQNRLCEVTLYILPRFLQSIINILKSRKRIPNIPNIDIIVFGWIIAILNYYYQNQSKCIKDGYRNSLKYFWGIN
ncbi:hypothetical protein pb186bvf_004242 [Paramecium bursaria]